MQRFRVCVLLYLIFLLGVVITLSPTSVFAATGTLKQINFQGKVVNKTAGTNITDGSYTFVFNIYSVSSGGSPIWTETKSVTVTNGIFQTLLGDTTSLPGSVDFNTDNIYLGINFNSDGEMSPRVRFSAVPQALNALKVAGLTVTDTTGTLTIPNGTTIAFSGTNNTTFTTTGSTNVTLPTTGTLATLAGTEEFTNKSIGSTGLIFNGASTDITTTSNEALTIAPAGTGDIVFNVDADSNVQFTATAVPGVDMVALSNSGQVVVADGVDGLSLDFRTGDGTNPTNSGINLAMTSGGTAAGDVLNGIKLSLSGTSGTERAIDLGTGWDASLYSTGNITTGGTATGTSATQFVLPVKTDSGDPTTTQTNGAIYYNSNSGKFRCYENSAWTDCIGTGGGTNYWRLANGSLSPVNDTLDFLIGNTASSSAKFAVLNVNTGTPTASVSATATGNGLALAGDGTIQSLRNNTLTIGGSTTGDISLSPLNGQGGVTIASSLATAARSTDLVTLSQANDGTRDSTGNLLQLTNSDTGSTAPLIDLSQVAGGNGIILSTAYTTGVGININLGPTSGSGVDVGAGSITSGTGLRVKGGGSGTLASFLGQMVDISPARNHTGATTITDSGNFLRINRSDTIGNASGTFNITGDVAAFSSAMTQTSGTISDTSHILSLTQSCGSGVTTCSGSVLDITNAGTGQGIKLTSSSTGDLAELDASGAGTTANGLLIQQTGAGTLTDAIDASDETITNALNAGANNIAITTGTIGSNAATVIDFSTFDLSSAGVITLAGAQTADITTQSNNALTLTPGGTGQLVLNSSNTSASAVDINATGVVAGAAITLDTTNGGITLTAAGASNGDIALAATDDININGTAGSLVNIGTSAVTQTITLGAATNTDLVLTDANWSVSGAGAANFVSVGATTAGTGAFTTLTSTGTTSLGNNSSTVAIDGTNYDLSTAGVVTLAGAQTADITSQSNNNITVLPGGTGDFVHSVDADSNVQITATAVPGVDMVALSNSGQVVVADGVDGLSLDFRTGDGSNPTNSGINLALTSGGTGTGDILNGINLTLSGTSGTERGIKFGTGFDTDILFATDATHTIKVEDQDTSAGAGSDLAITGAAGNTFGQGGAVTITAGAGGSSGSGGHISIFSGSAAGNVAGNVDIEVGTSSSSNGQILIGNAARASSIFIGNATAGTIRLGMNGGTVQIDGTNFDVATTGLMTLTGGLTTDITSQSNNNITVLPGGTGDFVHSVDADSNVQITATGVSAADMIAITNSGQAVTADTVDGISLTFVTGDGTNPTNSGINIALTSGGTAAGDVLNGIKLALSGTSGTERGIDLGTGWDASLYSTGNITLGGTATGTSATQLVLPIKTDSGDPTTTQTAGAIYYNSNSNKFRCFENSAWANCIGSGGATALDGLTAATTDDTALSSGDNTIEWDWALSSATSKAFTIGESAASTGGSGDQHLLKLVTASGSTAGPLEIVSTSADSGDIEFNLASSGDFEIQDAGTAFFTFNDDKSVAYSPLNSVGMTMTSSLAGGARSTDVLTITQANDGTNDSTGNLLQLTNSDTGSTVALLDISTAAAAGGAISITPPSAYTGSAGLINIASINNITSGNGILIGSTSGGSSSADWDPSGKLLAVDTGTSSPLTNTGTNSWDMSGPMLYINRNVAVNNAAGQINMSNYLAKINSDCTETSGTCTDTSGILDLEQNNPNASGTVLNIWNTGTGADIVFANGEAIYNVSDTIILTSDATNGAGVLRLPVKTTTGDPSLNVEGDMYYNTTDNKFRCYQNTGWTDCIGSGGSTTLSGAYTNGSAGNQTITLSTANDSIIVSNPTSSGSDSAFSFEILQQNTTAAQVGFVLTQSSNAADAVDITANSIDGETGLAISTTGLTTGKGITIAGGTSMTTGGGLSMTSGTYVHVTAETGNAINVTFADNSTNTSGATTTSGLNIAPSINTSGAGTKTINGLNIAATTLNGCSSGACTINDVLANLAANSNSGITQTGLAIASAGSSSAGTVIGVDVGNITSGNATEKGVRIGSGYDQDLEFVDTTPVIRLADASTLTVQDSSGNTLSSIAEYFSGANYATYEANGFINIDGHYFQDNFNLQYQAGTTTVTADVSMTSNFGDYREWVFDEAGTGNTTNTHTVMGGCQAGQNTAGMATNATNMGMLWLGLDSGGTFTNTQNDVGCRFMLANGTGTRTMPMLFPSKKYIQYFKVHVSSNFTQATVSNRYIKVGADNYSQTYPDEQNVTNTNSGGIYMGNLRSTNTTQVGGSVWSGFTKRGTNILTVDCTQNIVTATNQFALMRIEARDTNDIRFFMDNDVSNGISLTQCGAGISDTNAIPTWGLNPIIEIENNTSNMNGATNQWTMYIDLYAHVQDDPRPDAGQRGAQITQTDSATNPVAQAAADAPTVPQYDPINGADLAENYVLPERPNVGVGDVVSLGNRPGEALLSRRPNDRRLLGVVSDSPSLVVGDGSENTLPIAMTGRVRTRVNRGGGAISIGDPITSSGVAGVGMKATQPGRILGTAMEDFDSADEGYIFVNINPGYYLGEEAGQQLVELGDELQMVPDPTATESGLIATDSATASATDSASPSGSAQGFVNRISNFMKGVNVTGVFQSLGDSIFKGPSTFFAHVFFKEDVAFEGKVQFNKDSAGYATIAKGERFVDVVFEHEYIAPPVVNASLLVPQISADKLDEKITEGVCVSTDTVDSCQDKVADNLLGSGIKYVIIGQSTQGFMIKLNKPAESDLTLSWNAIAVKDATTFKSKSTQLGPTAIPTTPASSYEQPSVTPTFIPISPSPEVTQEPLTPTIVPQSPTPIDPSPTPLFTPTPESGSSTPTGTPIL